MLIYNTMFRFYRLFAVILMGISLYTSVPLAASAQESGGGRLSAIPAVIDEKAKTRDILNESITLENTSIHKIVLFPSINDIQIENGEQRFSGALSGSSTAASLAAWIELSRATIEINAGEKKSVPFLVRVDPKAAPGSYHVVVSFAEGGTREEAEKQPPLASVTVNVDVQADIKEILQLNAFTTGSVYLSGDDVLFNYRLENIGNQSLSPHGDIRIYNRKGVEVASVDVNKEGKPVSPDQKAQLASVWEGAQGFGQYKALLNVYYGQSQVASVQDTVFFWIIPWKQLLIMFIVGLIALVFAAFYAERWLEQRGGGLAHAHSASPTPVKPIAPAASLMPSIPKTAEPLLSRAGWKAAPPPPALSPLSAVLPKPQVPTMGTPVVTMSRHLASIPAPLPTTVASFVPQVSAPISVMAPISPIVFAPTVASVPEAHYGDTIDLKSLRNIEEPIADSHVINLKSQQ